MNHLEHLSQWYPLSDFLEDMVKGFRQFYPYGFTYTGHDGETVDVSWKDPESVEKLREYLRTPPDGTPSPEAQPSDEEEQEFPGDPLSRENVEKWNQKKQMFKKGE